MLVCLQFINTFESEAGVNLCSKLYLNLCIINYTCMSLHLEDNITMLTFVSLYSSQHTYNMSE